MADVKISEHLFVELYKFFCMDPGSADYDYIVSELQRKNTKIAERLEYAAALPKQNKRDA